MLALLYLIHQCSPVITPISIQVAAIQRSIQSESKVFNLPFNHNSKPGKSHKVSKTHKTLLALNDNLDIPPIISDAGSNADGIYNSRDISTFNPVAKLKENPANKKDSANSNYINPYSSRSLIYIKEFN